MFASPFVHHALAVIPLVCCLTIGVLLLVRSGNAGRGRGLILIAASLLGLYGVLGLTYRVLRILHPIVVPRFGEASAEKTQLQAFTDNVMQPAWAYSNSVLITLVILVLVPAMIRSRSPGRLDPPATRGHPESAPFSAPGAWPPVPPPPQARPWPPDPPGDPRRRAAPRPGSHRRSEPFPEVPPAQGTEPPRPRGRHRAPDPPDAPPPHH